MFCPQDGLGQLASKFGTSPAELLKEENTLVTGVEQVRENRGSQTCLLLQGDN